MNQEGKIIAAFTIFMLVCCSLLMIFSAFYLDPSFGIVTTGEVIGYTMCCSEDGDCVECTSIRFKDFAGQWQTVNLRVQDIPRTVTVRYLPFLPLDQGWLIIEGRLMPHHHSTGVITFVMGLVLLLVTALIVIIWYIYIAR